MPDLDLYGKTELWVVGIDLTGARLPELARAAAVVLQLDPTDVFVTDVRDGNVVFDILAPRVDLAAVAGRQQDLLDALAGVDGVSVRVDADVHSRGVLGVLGAPKEDAAQIVAAADGLAERLLAYVAQQVAVVSTGAELRDGRVHDTNVEAIAELMGAAGYRVVGGGTVPDDERAIAGRVARLVEEGHGLVFTTGGVGAEDKDRTIEALQLLDSQAATAVLATYAVGHGRHVKPHVRVAVARVGDALVIALPGPTREVRAGVEAARDALRREEPAELIVERVATAIRALWPGGSAHHDEQGGR